MTAKGVLVRPRAHTSTCFRCYATVCK